MAVKILTPGDLTPKIAVVVGTRPGIVKLAPVIKELERRGESYFIVHTGQHYSANMDRVFFENLDLPQPAYTTDAVKIAKYHGEQTAEMIKGVERALLAERPAVVVVGGDANTNLAGAIAARKLVNIALAHVEAGLRSNDWRMPEEHNRVMIDHISEILFAPTEDCRRNLEADNVRGHILVTGNTIVDAVRQTYETALRKSTIHTQLQLDAEAARYVLLTMHREENVDHKPTLDAAVANLSEIAATLDGTVLFPMHPRTRERFEDFGLMGRLESISGVVVIEPIGYLDMLKLLGRAQLVMTDSGGIQEEACILHVPCLTLRENTERPETVQVGANRVVGMDLDKWREAVAYFREHPREWTNPFGDGRAAKRIVDALVERVRSKAPGTASAVQPNVAG